MFQYQTQTSSCPKCGHIFYRGSRDLGPGIVTCKACGTLADTYLNEWHALLWNEKMGQIAKELFTPTFFGITDSVGLRIIFSMTLYVLFMVPIFVVVEKYKLSYNTAVLLVLLLFYPLLLCLRLIFMIRKSNYRKRTGHPPRF
jgi:hypothetical protein